jgi:hypothetical protein
MKRKSSEWQWCPFNNRQEGTALRRPFLKHSPRRYTMEHDFSVNGSYAVAAIQMLLSVSIIFQGIAKRYDILGRLIRAVAPYFYSFSPVVMLVYMLYVVSYNLK